MISVKRCLHVATLLVGDVRHEGLAVLGDAVDGEQQFVHAGDQGDLGQLAAGEQPLVVRSQPGVAAYRAECWHPQGGAQLGVADGGDGAARVVCRLPDCLRAGMVPT